MKQYSKVMQREHNHFHYIVLNKAKIGLECIADKQTISESVLLVGGVLLTEDQSVSTQSERPAYE